MIFMSLFLTRGYFKYMINLKKLLLKLILIVWRIRSREQRQKRRSESIYYYYYLNTINYSFKYALLGDRIVDCQSMWGKISLSDYLYNLLWYYGTYYTASWIEVNVEASFKSLNYLLEILILDYNIRKTFLVDKLSNSFLEWLIDRLTKLTNKLSSNW